MEPVQVSPIVAAHGPDLLAAAWWALGISGVAIVALCATLMALGKWVAIKLFERLDEQDRVVAQGDARNAKALDDIHDLLSSEISKLREADEALRERQHDHAERLTRIEERCEITHGQSGGRLWERLHQKD